MERKNERINKVKKITENMTEIKRGIDFLSEENEKLKEENEVLKEENIRLKTELDEFKQKEANQAKKNDQALTEAEKEAQELLAQIEDLGRAMNIN